MALTAAQLTKLKALHGEKFLQAVTHPESQPGPIDETVVETALEMCVADFRRRGYPISETHVEALYYCVLYIAPATMHSTELKELAQRRDALYPMRGPEIAGTATAAGEEGDRRNFSDDQLKALDQIRRRPGKNDMRGIV